jgi:hypothetical protein
MGQALKVAEETSPKCNDEAFAGGSGQVLLHEGLRLTQERDQDHKRRHEYEQPRSRARDEGRESRVEDRRERLPIQHVVHRELQRERLKQRQRAGEQADRKQPGDEGPRRARVARYLSDQVQLAGAGRCHR